MFILILMVDRNLWMGYQKQHAFLSQLRENTVIQFGKKQGCQPFNVIFVYQNVSDIQASNLSHVILGRRGDTGRNRGYWRVGDRLPGVGWQRDGLFLSKTNGVSG